MCSEVVLAELGSCCYVYPVYSKLSGLKLALTRARRFVFILSLIVSWNSIPHVENIPRTWPNQWCCPSISSLNGWKNLQPRRGPLEFEMWFKRTVRDYHFLLLTPSCHFSKTTLALEGFLTDVGLWEKTKAGEDIIQSGWERVEGVCEFLAAMQWRQHETGIINPGLHTKAHKNTNPPLDLAHGLFSLSMSWNILCLEAQTYHHLMSLSCHTWWQQEIGRRINTAQLSGTGSLQPGC